MKRTMLSFCFFCMAWPISLWAQQTAKVSERQVTFVSAGGTIIAGTLELPATPGSKAPALLLLAGSGPTDRNGNSPKFGVFPDLLKQIAQDLANHGIATLRFDKRGMYANAAQLPKDASQYATFFSYENYVGDAAAAYRFLRDQPEIDPAHTGILGHSEGGQLALAASKSLENEANPPAGLILLSTCGRTIDVLLEEQIKDLLKKQKATPDITQYYLSENHRILEAIRTTGQVPDGVPSGLALLYQPDAGKFLQSEMLDDPVKLATAFPGPVLVMIGASDQQVSPELDALALDSAFKSRPHDDHTLVVIPNASHNLKIVKSSEDAGFTGELSPDALDKLETWSAAKLSH